MSGNHLVLPLLLLMRAVTAVAVHASDERSVGDGRWVQGVYVQGVPTGVYPPVLLLTFPPFPDVSAVSAFS